MHQVSLRRIAQFGPALLLLAAAVATADPYDTAPPYMRPVMPGVTLTPIITTGQQVPLTGGPVGSQYRFVGIPDGLGAFGANGTLTLLCNHEFNFATSVAGPALGPGARISELTVSYTGAPAPSATIVSARDAVLNVYAGEPPVLQAPGARRIARLCSGYMGSALSGFDRPIFFNGEEAEGASTFDGTGGSAFATWNNDLYQLPRLGRAAWENVVALPYTGDRTVLFGLEDGPALASQLYMYVGTKSPGHSDWLTANGLNNGQLYVLASLDAARHDEATFLLKNTSVPCEWRQVNYNQTDAQLEAQSQALSAFDFVRVEDGAYRPGELGTFYFVTTGGAGGPNPFGRTYRLSIDPADPLAGATLTMLMDGTEGVVSPDNIDINALGQMMIQEDPNYNLANPPLSLPRDTYLWMYDLNTTWLTPVAEIDRAPAIAHALGADVLNSNVAAGNSPGGWESSGIIDGSRWFGPDSWLLDVQAHSLRINPVNETVQGGQVLLLTVAQPTGIQDAMGVNGWEDASGYHVAWSIDAERLDGFRVSRSGDATGSFTAVHDGLLDPASRQIVDRPAAGIWYYRVEALRGGEVVSAAGPVRAVVGGDAPIALAIDTPTPNPSAERVSLSFTVPAMLVGTHAHLDVYDVRGRLVVTLFEGTLMAGRQVASWNGRDVTGQQLSGVFFARLTTDRGVVTQRITRVH